MVCLKTDDEIGTAFIPFLNINRDLIIEITQGVKKFLNLAEEYSILVKNCNLIRCRW